jgi:hypothetical protein
MVRECLAPSFTMTNIYSCLPKLNEKMDLLKKIFLQNEKDDISFDVAEIFPRLLMDMLTTAMFDIDYHTLEMDGGEDRLLMKDLCVAVKEMMQKNCLILFGPLCSGIMNIEMVIWLLLDYVDLRKTFWINIELPILQKRLRRVCPLCHI